MSPQGYREGERKQEGKRRGKEVARRTDEGQVGKDLLISYIIKMCKLYYVPGTTLNVINSIISFRTNLRDSICDKYSIEKICSLGSSGHLKRIQLPYSEQKQP